MRAKFTIAPVFPAELRAAGVSGEATVSFVIDSQGNVQNAHVVKSSHKEFEAPALEALAQWKFDPGIKAGRNVHTLMQVPLVFELVDDDESDWF